MSRLGRRSAEGEGGTLPSVGTIGRFALVRTRARARWVANGVRWLGKVAHKKRRHAWHASRRSAESLKNLLLNAVKSIYRTVRRPARTASRRHAHLVERWRFYRTEWSIEREIDTIVNRDRLLVAGPWISEAGFETLYWVTPIRFPNSLTVRVSFKSACTMRHRVSSASAFRSGMHSVC